jgi:hypothetical protein
VSVHTVLEKIVPQLSEAAFIGKEAASQAIHQRLDATDYAELSELNGRGQRSQDLEEDVDETEEITANRYK